MPQPGIMDPGDAQQPADFLQQALLRSQKKVVLVLDLVESVRLMASDEVGTVSRWLDFTRHAENKVIPAHQGRLVKSLGDGLMVEFEQPRQAVAAAQTLHDTLEQGNAGLPPERHMRLRAGINTSQVYSSEHDIYGNGVNLTSRLANLAQPGETIISAGVRDELTDGLDAQVHDLGDCYVKHVQEPVRAYRISPVREAVRPQEQPAQLLPTIAVIPFLTRSNEPEHFDIGELIADGIIALLSRSGQLKVISRLSATVFRQRNAALKQLKTHLGADYVLSGSYVVSGSRLLINVELAQTRDHHIAWADRLSGEVQDLLQAESELSHQIADATQKALLDTEVQKTLTQPLPTLQSYSLMLGGVHLMHRSTPREFDMSRQVLELLLERHRLSANARTWLAMWYVLRTTRGMARDAQRESRTALDHTQRALDIDPNSSLALAMEAFVHCHMKKDTATAEHKLVSALELDPCNALAWLFKSTVDSLRGNTAGAVNCAEHAMALSPTDPLRYYYLSLAGSAALSDGQWLKAADLASQSWRLNRSHLPTVRALVIANSELGRHELARVQLTELRRLDPQLTVRSYLDQAPGGANSLRQRFGEAMARVGLPRC